MYAKVRLLSAYFIFYLFICANISIYYTYKILKYISDNDHILIAVSTSASSFLFTRLSPVGGKAHIPSLVDKIVMVS